MTDVLGWNLDRALEALRASGISDAQVVRVARPGKPYSEIGTERVIRVSQDGRTLMVARFPDEVSLEGPLE